MRLIDGDPLYEEVQHSEELATNRVLDTESTLPYPNNLNPSYIRYVAQMNERTRLKHMIEDAPTIKPDRSLWFRIGETCVAESKGFISAEMAVEKIRELLREGW